MIYTTLNSIDDKKIGKTLGVAKGNTVRARHVGKDILAGFKTLVGGEIQEYTKLIGEASRRLTGCWRMREAWGPMLLSECALELVL